MKESIISIRSNIATIQGHIRPSIRIEPNKMAAICFARMNWSIAKWETESGFRYVARFSDGVHEVYHYSWDRENGIELYTREPK